MKSVVDRVAGLCEFDGTMTSDSGLVKVRYLCKGSESD